ncbi:MAG: hypothetical protein ABSB34_01395 [Candidatus Limnocylindrales bacterium]|jgi:hypothetical protein
MTDRDKNRDETPATDDYLAGDEEFEEELEQTFEGEGEAGEGEGEAGEGEGEAEGEGPAGPASGARRRFGFGRSGRAEEEVETRQMGSVRGTHERIHVDDRPSALYALVCAAALLGVLAFSWLGGVLPKAAGPTLTPLVVPTSQATAIPSGSAAASASVTPSASPAATLSPAPSASPS